MRTTRRQLFQHAVLAGARDEDDEDQFNVDEDVEAEEAEDRGIHQDAVYGSNATGAELPEARPAGPTRFSSFSGRSGTSAEGVVRSSTFDKKVSKRVSMTRFLLPILPSRDVSQVSGSIRNFFSVYPGESSAVPSREVSVIKRSILSAGNQDAAALELLAASGIRTSATSLTEHEASGPVTRCLNHVRFARLQLWLLLEEPFLHVSSSLVSGLMVLIIFASIGHSIYLNQQAEEAVGPFEAEWVELFFNCVFCADLLVRFCAFPVPSRFLRQPKNVIDTVCVLPFLLNEILMLPTRSPSLSFLQQLQVYEAYFRVLKLSRYFWGWQLLFRAVIDSAKALSAPLYYLILIVVLGSCTILVFEAAVEEEQQQAGGDATSTAGGLCALDDLYCFEENGMVTIRTLPDAIHFSILCILSMSTGPFYGMQAVSWAGQAAVCALMVLGVAFMAMPITIVGCCFAQTWFDQDRVALIEKLRSRLIAQGCTPDDLREVFDEVDANRSGMLEFEEFMEIIKAFFLQSLPLTKCRQLFRYFDADGDGAINFMDFALSIYPDLPLEEEGSWQVGTVTTRAKGKRRPSKFVSRVHNSDGGSRSASMNASTFSKSNSGNPSMFGRTSSLKSSASKSSKSGIMMPPWLPPQVVRPQSGSMERERAEIDQDRFDENECTQEPVSSNSGVQLPQSSSACSGRSWRMPVASLVQGDAVRLEAALQRTISRLDRRVADLAAHVNGQSASSRSCRTAQRPRLVEKTRTAVPAGVSLKRRCSAVL